MAPKTKMKLPTRPLYTLSRVPTHHHPSSAPVGEWVASRTVLCPADVRPAKAPPAPLPPAALKYIMHGGRLVFQSDYIAVRGSDSQVYYAVVRDFWFTPEGAKMFTMQWLLPRAEYAAEADGPCELLKPEYFTLGTVSPSPSVVGPEHEQAESMNAVIAVFYSPATQRKQMRQPDVVTEQLDERPRKRLHLYSSQESKIEDVEAAQLLCSMA